MCHHYWPEIGFEGSGQVDIEQNTGFLQNVMKHLDHDTKQEGIFGVVNTTRMLWVTWDQMRRVRQFHR